MSPGDLHVEQVGGDAMTDRSDFLTFRLRVPEEARVEHGVATVLKYRLHGRAWIDGSHLHLEWSGDCERTEAGRGVARQVREPVPVGHTAVPLDDIAQVRLRGGWWWPRVDIAAAAPGALDGVPGVAGARISLRISRGERAAAAHWIVQAELAQADRALRAAEAAAELPPPNIESP
jgi:hypothetical protein